jgi:hypothetical protein
MAQATATSTDELLSQLAASEIDRLLSEADGKTSPASPEPIAEKAPVAPITQGNERTALLEAAGFEKAEAPLEQAPTAPPPAEDERSALLQAAGFESPQEVAPDATPEADLQVSAEDDGRIPFYLKPLIWMNIPFEDCPLLVRQMLGRAGIVTLVNALAVLTYVFFFKKR